MLRRSKKQQDPKQQHYIVIAIFCAVCLLSVLFVIFNPKQKFSEIRVLDEGNIMVHNGQGHQFKHGANSFFEGKTMLDARQLFSSALSDTNQINPCRSSLGVEGMQEMDIDVPDEYDWRQKYPQCVQPVQNIGSQTNCSASYAFSTLSAV